MESRLLALSHWFSRLPAWTNRHRAAILLIVSAVTAAMIWAAVTHTRLDMTIDSFIDPDDPAIEALDNFRSQFGSDDSVYLVYEAKDGDVFSARSLRAVDTLTRRLADPQDLAAGDFPDTMNGQPVDLSLLHHTRRVESLTTLRIQRGTDDTLLSERLVPLPLPEEPARLREIRQRALANEDFLQAFYSRDGRFAALRIQTTFGAEPEAGYARPIDEGSIELADSFSGFDDAASAPAFDPDATVGDIPFRTVDMTVYSGYYTAVRAVYQDLRDRLAFHPVGNPSLMDWVYRELQDMMGLGLVIVALFILLLWLLFRSLAAIVLPLLVVSLSLLWAWGAVTLAGLTLSTMITLTCLLVFAVGLADCIHVLSAYFATRRRGTAHDAALTEALDRTGPAIMITTVTTMCGVLALTWSDLVPIRVFGIMSAAGVLVAFLLTVVLLPVLLDRFPPSVRAAPAPAARKPAIGGRLRPDHWLPACPRLTARHPALVLALFGAAFAGALYGTARLEVDSNVSELTSPGSEPREAYRVVDRHMAGAQTLSVMIDSGRVDGLTEPALLRAIQNFQQRVERRYPGDINRSWSLADVVANIHRAMRNNDPAAERIPDDATLIAQLLYLFSSANPDERRSLVSDDYSRAHITLNARNAGSHQYRALFRSLEEDIDAVFDPLATQLPALQVNVTGSVPLMMRAMDEIATTQYRSFLLALVVVSVIMVLTLGSVQAGLIAMLPNLLPALSTFGLMGALSIPLDPDTLLIAPVIIGIAVDDTVHFMTHYRVSLMRGRDMQQALDSTVRVVGRAVLFTTLILATGFALLGFSDYLGIARIGVFGSIAILIALLCDLFLLPAMLMLFRPRFGMTGLKTFPGKEVSA